ncbi:Transmembrane channel-like protein 7 [Merluccius polli]|uniref:Transmembrane channel-like protein n=1 Tax=Merluccius polli TaxID=89951 RepID=A0AA47MQ08_MERPO|nr:Transmembrane channel-like protein 7 [Merluccius polli]
MAGLWAGLFRFRILGLEPPKTVVIDGSTRSSEDSSLYCPNKIVDHLPGTRAPEVPLCQEPSSSDPEEVCRGPVDGVLPVGHWSGRHADKPSALPVRELAKSIQEKRAVRDTRNRQPRSLGVWESWGPTKIIHTKRLGGGTGWAALSSLLLWRHSLHTIESRFGVGVKAYFIFLRYLMYLNLLHSVFLLAFILGPTVVYGRGSINDSLSFRDEDSPLDFFLGTGFLDRSPVFYGFYKPGSLNYPCLNTPILYFTGILTVLTLSLIMVVRRMGVGYKRSWFLGKRHSVNVSFKIFCGWDFTIQDPDAAGFKHSSIRNDLKLYLEEQNFNLREAQRTLIQWVGLYTLRVTLNLIVLFLLGGAFYLIQYTTLRKEPEFEQHNFGWFWRKMLNQYLPAITIALINLIIPHIFRKISSFEDYSLTTQVNATLMRSSFLKLASLGMFLFFIQTGHQQVNCWENQFGREMYKLYMFDFIINICRMLLLDYPTMLLKERCPSCWLARLSGKQRFLVPFNVLDLVYNQTVLWAGVFYCPVLPFLGIVKLVAVFFFKKFKVLRCCVPEERLFRASSASFFFHFMLLLGLFMAAGMLGLFMAAGKLGHDHIISNLSSCGPFDGGASIANVTSVCVASLPGPAQNTLNSVASYSFAMLLILIEILIFTFLVVLGRANRRAIDRLKNQLVIQYMLVLVDYAAAKDSDSFNRSDLPAAQPDPPADPPTGPPSRPPNRPPSRPPNRP